MRPSPFPCPQVGDCCLLLPVASPQEEERWYGIVPLGPRGDVPAIFRDPVPSFQGWGLVPRLVPCLLWKLPSINHWEKRRASRHCRGSRWHSASWSQYVVAPEASRDVPSARGCAALPYGFHKLNLSRKRTVNLYVRSRAWLIESKGFPAKHSPTIHRASALHVYRTNPEKNGINVKPWLCCNPDVPKSGAGCPLWVTPMAGEEVARIPPCLGWVQHPWGPACTWGRLVRVCPRAAWQCRDARSVAGCRFIKDKQKR